MYDPLPLFARYQGYISAALVLGGCDVSGAHLYTVWPHGSTDKLPFVSMGSGSLAAMSVLESGFKEDMTVWSCLLRSPEKNLVEFWHGFFALQEEEAKQLVRDAICSGIFNDLGSGSNVDLCVIRTVRYLLRPLGQPSLGFNPPFTDRRENLPPQL